MSDADLLEPLKELSKGCGDLRERGAYSYAHMVDWVLRNGRIMKPPREPWSPVEQAFIDRMTARSYFQASECIANAQGALLFWWIGNTAPGERGPTGKIHAAYCEGYAVAHGFPFLHAWLLLNGKVWDPTDDANAREVSRLGGTWQSPAYYIGSEFDTAFMLRRMVKRRGWVTILDDWEHGWPVLRSDDWRTSVTPPTVAEVLRAMVHASSERSRKQRRSRRHKAM